MTLVHILQLGGIAATAFVVGFSGAMMPGPLLAVTVSETSRRGGAAGPLLVLGHMMLEGALVAAIACGVAGFLTDRVVIGAIGIAGGATMCWMGQGMIRSVRRLSLSAPAQGASRMHPVVAGVVVSLSNPYWTIWWATIGMSYIVMGLRFGIPGILAFFAGHILADFTWYTFVSVALARGKKLMPDNVYRAIILFCGGALFISGVWFFWTGAGAIGKAWG
jgi:threonine/homoserine/homoserine lactone efflux protein